MTRAQPQVQDRGRRAPARLASLLLVALALAAGGGCSGSRGAGAPGTSPPAPGRVLTEAEAEAIVAGAESVTPVGEPVVTLVKEDGSLCSEPGAGCVARRASRDYVVRAKDGRELRLGISCQHEGCDPPDNCSLNGCDPTGANQCNAPTCGSCTGKPKGCKKTVSQ
jgi:hypothetical protein